MKNIFLLSFLFFPFVSIGQTVRGYVFDNRNEPITGITITLKETESNTTTDKQGRFAIAVPPEGGILVFSGIGYSTVEVQAEFDTELKVNMSGERNNLDEVQVIGYGTTTRRYNVGSVTTIKAEDIAKQPVSNPLAALQGRVPGLVISATSGLPGASFNVQVRGQNTLSSSVQGLGVATPLDNPLYIIDGVPFAPQNGNINQLRSIQSPGGATVFNNQYGGSSPFNSINPADIESIEVLRDADATAIYGSRGGNGVILITTKRGANGKTEFTADVSSGVSVIGKTIPMMDTREYLAMRREALANDGLEPNLTLWDPAYAPDLLAFDDAKHTDWKDYFMGNTARNTIANASISGGNQYTNFRLSAGFNRNTYIFPGDFSESRTNLAVNLQHRSVDSRFGIDFSANYSYTINNSSGSPDLLMAYRLEPNFPDLLDDHDNLVWSYNGIDLGMGINGNPIAYLRNLYSTENTLLNSSLQLSYKVSKALQLRASLGYNTVMGEEYFGNPLSAQNPHRGLEAEATFGNNNFGTWIAEPQLEYRKPVGQGTISILIGGTIQYSTNDKTQITGIGYANDDLLGSINGASDRYVSDGFSEYRYAAVFGRANYRLKDKYILNLTARRDGSSRFGPGRQFGNFGSIGAGWLFSEEKFISDNLHFLSYGKLRASYGITGSDAIGDYQYIPRWAPTTYPYNGVVGYSPQNHFNPTLSWASTRKWEAGLELGVYQDRILLTSTYFRNRSGDQLVSYYLPTQTGFGSVVDNWDALVQNTGFEFVLQTNNLQKQHFGWTSSFNLSVPRNELIAFPDLETSPYATRYVVGRSLGTIYGFDFAGVNPETGLFQFRNAQGELTSSPVSPSGTSFNDFIPIGNRDPKFYGGLQNTLRYKGIQLDLFLEFRKQLGTNFLQQAYTFTPGHQYNVPAALLDRWQKEGDMNDLQRFTASYGDAYRTGQHFVMSSGVYSDASYIRLRNLNLSYTFGSATAARLGLSRFRIHAAAQNLFTFSGYQGNDPETQSLYGVPVLKTFVLGINLTL